MEVIYGIFEKLYSMTAISDIAADPTFIVMYLLAFVLLYLGIVRKYEPLLLIPLPSECLWPISPAEIWEWCRLIRKGLSLCLMARAKSFGICLSTRLPTSSGS